MPDSSAPPAAASFAERSFSSQRARRQLGLFFAGAGFFAVTTLITRRSIMRKYRATVPKFYQANDNHSTINGGLEAFEALSVATINVMSVGIMAAGGFSYAFDISSMDDIRKSVKSSIAVGSAGGSDQETEKEVEEWFASILGRKDLKEKLAKQINDNKEKRESESQNRKP